MKKLIKTASAVAVALSMAVPAFAAPADNSVSSVSKFKDIDSPDFAWAKTYINSMVEKGLISGYEDGTFRPDNDVTRLEALSLFARAMGSNDSVNKPLLEIAHDKYDNVIKTYGLSWGEDEIAYLMYKGALKKTDLDTYLKDQEKNNPMKRYEAAIIITKALGGEEKALSELGVVLDYTDAREVPSNAIQYVAYSTEAGIMAGMGDGTFSPKTAVKRSQMAVMLSRTVDKADYTFRKMKITDIDTSLRNITASENGGKEEQLAYTDEVVLRSMGDEVQAKDLGTGVDAVMTFSAETLAAVDTISSQPDQTISGRYQNYASNNGRVTIRIIPDGETEAKSYECGEDLSVMYDGSPATVKSFTSGDVITLNLVNGKIAKITGETKTSTITGAVIENISISGDVTITISHGNEAYDGQTYLVSSDVIVNKNGAPTELDSIYKGDKVSITLEYGVITKITATSSQKTVEGTIRELTISSQSTMKVNVNGEEKEYQIPRDVKILINGEEGSLYDFRVGDLVKITIESDAVTKIVATTTQESSGHVTGVVTAFNSSFGVISIQPDDAGGAVQVYAKDDTCKFITAEGLSKKMSNIKTGQTVDVRGTVSNGVFVAKLIVIVSE